MKKKNENEELEIIENLKEENEKLKETIKGLENEIKDLYKIKDKIIQARY